MGERLQKAPQTHLEMLTDPRVPTAPAEAGPWIPIQECEEKHLLSAQSLSGSAGGFAALGFSHLQLVKQHSVFVFIAVFIGIWKEL